MKGARPDEKDSQLPMVERFTHFLEEAKYRGLDLKRYAPLIRAILDNQPPPQQVAEKLAELDELCAKTALMKPDSFYMDREGKVYRCIRVLKDSAILLRMDTFAGKSLDAVVQFNANKWRLFSPLRDDQKRKAYQERFDRFLLQHPNFMDGVASD